MIRRTWLPMAWQSTLSAAIVSVEKKNEKLVERFYCFWECIVHLWSSRELQKAAGSLGARWKTWVYWSTTLHFNATSTFKFAIIQVHIHQHIVKLITQAYGIIGPSKAFLKRLKQSQQDIWKLLDSYIWQMLFYKALRSGYVVRSRCPLESNPWCHHDWHCAPLRKSYCGHIGKLFMLYLH